MALPFDATGQSDRGIYVTDLPDLGWLELCAMTLIRIEGQGQERKYRLKAASRQSWKSL